MQLFLFHRKQFFSLFSMSLLFLACHPEKMVNIPPVTAASPSVSIVNAPKESSEST